MLFAFFVHPQSLRNVMVFRCSSLYIFSSGFYACYLVCSLFSTSGVRSKWQIDPKKYCLNRRVLVFLSHISRRFTRWLCICGLTEIVHYIIDGLFLSFSHRNLLPAVLCLIVVVVMCRSGKHSFFFVRCSLSFRSNRDRQFTSCQHNNQIPSLINNRCVHHFISHQITMNEINQAIEMASTNMYVPCEVHTEHTNIQQQKIV